MAGGSTNHRVIDGIGVFVFASWVLNFECWVLGFGFSSRNWGHDIAIQTDKTPFAGQPTNHRVIG